MKVGVAQVDITPSEAVELSGFALREQPSIGVLDRLAVRAIYLTEGATELLWIHCDLIALSETTVASFRRWAKQRFRLGGPQVLLTATHTHSGPATIALREAGACDANYLEFLDGCFHAAAERASLDPVECEVVTTECCLDLAVHRCGPATIHTDPRVGLMGFRRPDGAFVAAIVNYSIHPVALGHGNRQVSGDLTGVAATEIARQLPGNPVVLVTNGACGNLNPPPVNVAPALMQEWAHRLAAAAVFGLHGAPVCREGRLRTMRRLVALPLDWLDAAGIEVFVARTLDRVPDDGFGRRVRAGVRAWADELLAALTAGRAPPRTQVAELHSVQLADVVLVGVNAEIFSVFTDWLRRDTGLAKVYTIGYANGDLGYLCTREAYPEGGYEVDLAHIFYGGYRFQAGALELLAREAAVLVRSLSKSPAAAALA
jgi:neutral ceramidase